MVSEHQQVVELQRSVRYGRLLIGGAVVGGLIGALATTFFPIAEGSAYSLGQIAGFMLLVGAVVGLAIGGILSLVLTLVARRNRGTGVVSIGTGSDVPADPTAGAAADLAVDTADGTVMETAANVDAAESTATDATPPKRD